jgi:ubiquinone/menaquinone biosynthesis C-methylase UbiE
MDHAVKAIQSPAKSSIVLHAAAGYDLLLSVLTLGRERAFRAKILRPANLLPGEQVLDIGCGTGTTAIASKQLVGPRGSVIGVDASPEMLARARKKAERAGINLEFKNAMAEALPFPDARFDVVLSTMMLHHLPAELRRKCALEVRRVLKPGGRVLAVDFTTAPGTKGIVAYFHRRGHTSLAEMVEIFRGSGMEISESGKVGFGDLHFVLAAVPAAKSEVQN